MIWNIAWMLFHLSAVVINLYMIVNGRGYALTPYLLALTSALFGYYAARCIEEA